MTAPTGGKNYEAGLKALLKTVLEVDVVPPPPGNLIDIVPTSM